MLAAKYRLPKHRHRGLSTRCNWTARSRRSCPFTRSRAMGVVRLEHGRRFDGHDMTAVLDSLDEAARRRRQAHRHHRPNSEGDKASRSWKARPNGTARRLARGACTLAKRLARMPKTEFTRRCSARHSPSAAPPTPDRRADRRSSSSSVMTTSLCPADSRSVSSTSASPRPAWLTPPSGWPWAASPRSPTPSPGFCSEQRNRSGPASPTPRPT